MNKLRIPISMVVLLVMILATTGLNADDEDKIGIPFRVSALEELTLLQQDQIEALSESDTSSNWFVVDSNQSEIGKVISFTSRPNLVVVETEFDGETTVLWINSAGFIFRNSELVFTPEDCQGQTFAVMPGDWWFNQVVIAVGPGEPDSVVPYKLMSEPADGHWMSHVLPDGECENAEFDAPAAPAEQLADNLYVVYPRAPNRWSLEQH